MTYRSLPRKMKIWFRATSEIEQVINEWISNSMVNLVQPNSAKLNSRWMVTSHFLEIQCRETQPKGESQWASQRSSFDETKGVLHTPIAFSASRNFLIQKVYNPAATFADWFAIYVGEYAFSYLPVFFYQHQLVIKREFTGKGVLAEVFCISSVQCGNKFWLLQSRLNYVGKQIQCPLDFFFGLSCSVCVNLSASASFLFGVLLPWQVSHLTDRIFCGFLKADDNLRVAVDIASES